MVEQYFTKKKDTSVNILGYSRHKCEHIGFGVPIRKGKTCEPFLLKTPFFYKSKETQVDQYTFSIHKKNSIFSSTVYGASALFPKCNFHPFVSISTCQVSTILKNGIKKEKKKGVMSNMIQHIGVDILSALL